MSDGQRGFALLVVLWSLALLALLGTQLTSTARSELQLAHNLRQSAVLQAQADGLVYATLFRLMSDTVQERGVDGITHPVAVADGSATVRVTSLAGKVNPNTVSESLMAGLMEQVGVPPGKAATLAAAVADWRTPGQVTRPAGAKDPQYRAAGLSYGPPGQPFETIDELRQVLGFSPNLLARLAPHLTVAYQGFPVIPAADPTVRAALLASEEGELTPSLEGPENNGVYVQVVVQVVQGGEAAERRAIVWAGHGPRRGNYLVLAWGTPP